MSMFDRFFKRAAPVSPLPLRDTDGKFIPHKLAVRSVALEMAARMGRADLIARLTKSSKLPPAPPETADRDFGKTTPPEGTSAVAGQGKALCGANGVDVATFNFGAMQ